MNGGVDGMCSVIFYTPVKQEVDECLIVPKHLDEPLKKRIMLQLDFIHEDV